MSLRSRSSGSPPLLATTSPSPSAINHWSDSDDEEDGDSIPLVELAADGIPSSSTTSLTSTSSTSSIFSSSSSSSSTSTSLSDSNVSPSSSSTFATDSVSVITPLPSSSSSSTPLPGITPAGMSRSRPSLCQSCCHAVSPPLIDHRSLGFCVLCSIFVTCLLVADMIGSKFFLVDLFTVNVPLLGPYTFVTHSVGMIAFPVTFLLTDLINEYYGKRGARYITLVGLAMALLSFTLLYLARILPTSPQSPVDASSFEVVFGFSNRLYVASLVAFLLGQFTDITIFSTLKKLTRGRFVFLRATLSTMVSQLLDSFLVTTLLLIQTENPATSAPYTSRQISEIALTGFILKALIALLLIPFIYLGRWAIAKAFEIHPLPPGDD